jgi:hypothetical protein
VISASATNAGGIFLRPVALSPNDLDLIPVATPALTHARSERLGAQQLAGDTPVTGASLLCD